MNLYQNVCQQLQQTPKTWLAMGVVGFVGSNLLETLIKLDQNVVGLDNFTCGRQYNLDEVQDLVTREQQLQNFHPIKCDISDFITCQQVCASVDYVLHEEVRDAKVKSFTDVISSSKYGDYSGLSKVEDYIDKPLSPYAVTKYVNELYADLFAKPDGFKIKGRSGSGL